MATDQNAIDGSDGEGRNNISEKAYSVHVHAKAQSTASCSFCWFVLSVYPSLTGMTSRDSTTFKKHLEQKHGLQNEIRA